MKRSLIERSGSLASRSVASGLIALIAALAACAHAGSSSAAQSVEPATATTRGAAAGATRSPIADARQLIVVITPAWDSTSGTLRRYARDDAGAAWKPVGAEIPIVVGQTGLAWDAALRLAGAGDPVKREGDGKSPAGAFALDTAFGFQSRELVPWVRLPYVPLRESTECVDDTASVHYNTIVDRARVPSVDWNSSEKMRRISQYQLGVHVSYNGATPRRGGGSCIFLHIWAGPRSVTAGCTAMDAAQLEEIVRWLDPKRTPMIVQLPAGALATVRGAWGLP